MFFIGSLEAGGAERVATSLCNFWSKDESHQVFLVTGESCSKDFYKVEDTVNRISLNYSYKNTGFFSNICESITRFFKFSSVIKYTRPDAIILSCTDVAIRHLFNVVFMRSQIIVCEHNNYFAVNSFFKRILRNVTYVFADKVILLTKRDLINYPSFVKKFTDFQVIPNPNSYSKIDNVYESKFDKYRFNLLAVGRLTKQKSFDRLIRIMALMPSQYTLDIFGDGELKEELQELISKLELSNRVKLRGSSKDIHAEYLTHSVLCMTSIYEGLPMVILEANSFGLPVISYNCPTGPEELIKDNLTGCLIEDGDEESFREMLISMTNSKNCYDELSIAALHYSNEFSLEQINKFWESLVFKPISSK